MSSLSGKHTIPNSTKTPSLPAPEAAPPPGVPVRFGKYTLVERLGRGGMAEVWKAKMTGPAGFLRTLVVKRILPHLVEDPHFVDMFTAEARLSARLNHANIVQVYELGDVAGEFFLAMEYVRGRDLVSVMRQQLSRGRPDPGLGAYVMRDVCRALGYAHALTDDNGVPLRLIHRDVSPSNVMLAFDGAVKLLDFGIAKALSEANENKTQTGTLKGKFGYMSPEQVEGRPFDHRTDLFAAGIVLHETLTGRRLFKGQGDLQTIAMVRECRIDPPSFSNPDVSYELDRITLRALARNPEDRYQSCDEMAAELDQVVHQLKWGPERLRTLMQELFGDEPPETNARELAVGDPHASKTTFGKLLRRRRLKVVALSTVAALGVAGAVWLASIKRARLAAPPPVVVAPVVAPAPVVPAEIRLRVSSSPAGAAVVVAGEETERGRTPLGMKLPRGTETIKMVIKLAGYEDQEVEVVPDVDQSAQVALVKVEKHAPNVAPKPHPKRVVIKKEPKPAKPKPAPDLKRGDVVDPFAR
jgi:serine/threonine protein kinase